jgi:tRNA-specific 2-thiouridylase
LQQKLKRKNGKIIKIPRDSIIYQNYNENLQSLLNTSEKFTYSKNDGAIIGDHEGAHFYTIGQRKGLGIGGFEEPLFVIGIDVKENIIYVGEGKSHPGLYHDTIKVNKNDIHWVRDDLDLLAGNSMSVTARIRYRQPLQKATLIQEENALYISFNKPQSAVTSGQFITWYNEEELLGSGVIN